MINILLVNGQSRTVKGKDKYEYDYTNSMFVIKREDGSKTSIPYSSIIEIVEGRKITSGS